MELKKHLPAYRNPVADIYCADPFILRHERQYYAYGTHYVSKKEGVHQADSIHDRYFALLVSSDLVNWEHLGGALIPAAGFEGKDHWAPEVTFANGKFWMYYSTDDSQMQRLRIAVADHPRGPFHDQGFWLFPEEGFTIDAHPFRDPQDSQWYLFFSYDKLEGKAGTAIAVVPLAADMMTPLGKPAPVLSGWAEWHVSERNRLHYGQVWERWHTIEGAHVVYHASLYYLLYSGGAWDSGDYGVSFAVAERPLGPWRDEASAEGPAVLRGVPGHVIGPGHNSVFLAPDGVTLMCAYHAWDAAHTARRLCIDPIEWTANGPHVTPTYSSGINPGAS